MPDKFKLNRYSDDSAGQIMLVKTLNQRQKGVELTLKKDWERKLDQRYFFDVETTLRLHEFVCDDVL